MKHYTLIDILTLYYIHYFTLPGGNDTGKQSLNRSSTSSSSSFFSLRAKFLVICLDILLLIELLPHKYEYGIVVVTVRNKMKLKAFNKR